MTKTVNINEINNSVQALLALTRDGDEAVLEENGNPVVKIVPIETDEKPRTRERVFGLGKGYWMSDDFNDELPDEFWGWDKL